MFAGFNVAFLPMHLTGLLGMPRRVFTYPAGLGWDGLNLVSNLGAFVLALGIAVVAVDMFWPRGGRPYARRNPWNAGTPEWLTEMRSEEHTSELQSLMRISYAVFCLNKKKNKFFSH